MAGYTVENIDIRYDKEVLENGLTVVTVQMPHIHTVELAMFVRAGLRFENEANNGISHFLEHMLFRGNRKYPNSLALNREFENIGRDLRATTLTEYTYFGFNPHISNFRRGVELFAEFFLEPTFPEIELERQIIIEEYLEDLNAEGINIDIDNMACSILYKGTPLAMTTVGSRKSIESISPGMLREYFYKNYVPGNMVLTAAGPVQHEEFVELARKYFMGFPEGGQPVGKDYFVGTIVEDQTEPVCKFQFDANSQIQLQVCFRGVSYNHPDYCAMCLINRMFDDGVTSRLQRALREARGLVYSVECRVTSASDLGTLDFDVAVSSEKVGEVARVLFQEIRSFVESGPLPEELEHVKKRYIYDLDFDLDDPYKQIVRCGFTQLYSQEMSIEEEKGIVNTLTVDDIARVACGILKRERLNVIMVGPVTNEIEKEIEGIVASF